MAEGGFGGALLGDLGADLRGALWVGSECSSSGEKWGIGVICCAERRSSEREILMEDLGEGDTDDEEEVSDPHLVLTSSSPRPHLIITS